MLSDIQRAALRAAAKLAFSATIIGCGGGTAVEPANEPSTDEKTPVATTESTDDALRVRHPRRDAGVKLDTGVEGDTGHAPTCGYYPSQACLCKQVVADAFPDGGTPPPRWSPDPAPNMPPEVTSCCTLLAHEADVRAQSHDPNGWDWAERDTCCGVIGWNAAATCTPWGPPVPPAMRRNLKLGVA